VRTASPAIWRAASSTSENTGKRSIPSLPIWNGL